MLRYVNLQIKGINAHDKNVPALISYIMQNQGRFITQHSFHFIFHHVIDYSLRYDFFSSYEMSLTSVFFIQMLFSIDFQTLLVG